MKRTIGVNIFVLSILLAAAALAQAGRVVPQGTDIKVRTDTAIPAKPPANAIYAATVSNDVSDSSGSVIIPRGTSAQLVAIPTSDGKETNLDLQSVTMSGKRYLLTAHAASKGSSPEGIGANKRTAKYVGGGAAIGAVLGGLLGGGKGAAIGAIVGGAGGAGTQAVTGHKKELPAETELNFKLAQDLELQPASKQAAPSAQPEAPPQQ